MSQKYQYRVDAADNIVWVDGLWLAFAQENGAPELTKDTVLGRPLWDFIAGESTCRLFSELHGRVRFTHDPVVLPFRCDSPTVKRFMRLIIVEEAAGKLFYESILDRVEPQRYLAVLDSGAPRSDCTLTVCSCCKRGLLESVGWLELEDISVRLRVFDAAEAPKLQYSICPECGNLNSSDDGNAA